MHNLPSYTYQKLIPAPGDDFISLSGVIFVIFDLNQLFLPLEIKK